MGKDIASLFGGGFEAPEPMEYAAAPSGDQSEAEGAAARDAERKKNRARAGGIRSTLLNNPLGGNAALGG